MGILGVYLKKGERGKCGSLLVGWKMFAVRQ